MNSPTTEQIKTARKKAELTQQKAADLVYVHLNSWQKYESGDVKIPLAFFELFLIKTGQFMSTETDFALSESIRTGENMMRYGTVKEIKNGKARIEIGELLTDFLPFAMWVMPEMGEQVLVLSPSGDFNQGVCLAGINSTHALLKADIDLTGSFKATGDVTDKTRAMQGDRDIYNQHKHSDPQGGEVMPTGQAQ